MTVNRAAVFVAVLAMCCQPAFASAGKQTAAKRIRSHAARSPDASGHLVSDFIKGSSGQQELERRDNDLATMRPVDHRKDDFFSDWRGLR